MITLNNVKKTYSVGENKTLAVNGISTTIEQGEFVSIMGASGSGKSTLLNVIGCMDTLSEGEYFYNDVPVHNLKGSKLHKFRKNHVSFVFQNFALMNHYTVYENVEFPLLVKNVPRKERKKIVMKHLEMLGISDLARKLPIHISGGQQQRCAIGRALTSGNDLILADEPTGALDKKNGKEIMDIFEQINKEGKTVIIVTHDDTVAARTNRIIQIEDGKMLGE